jgi:hypothetical protein
MTLTRRKESEPRRPPECRAELTRLNAEDLTSSSSSSDNDEKERPKSPTKAKTTDHGAILKDLPPNGKSLSRNGSKEENLVKRESLNTAQKSDGKSILKLRLFWVNL